MELHIASISGDGIGPEIVAEAKKAQRLIDATQGRKTESVIITDSDHIILSYLSNDEIYTRQAQAKE